MSFILHNGDSSTDEGDDDVFIKSKLDMMVEGVRDEDDYLHDNLQTSDYVFCDNDLEIQSPFTPFSTPSPKKEQTAIIFSVNFCGKNFGELGLFEPDISILDWNGFKSYLFSSLNLEYYPDCTITYSDEDGDKIPIDTESEYQEALRVAKYKASKGEKVILDITRVRGFPYSSLRSLVSSGIRRVNSVGSKNSEGTATPGTKSVTTSTSFLNFENATVPTTTSTLDFATDYLCFEDSPDLVRSENPNTQPQHTPQSIGTKGEIFWRKQAFNKTFARMSYGEDFAARANSVRGYDAIRINTNYSLSHEPTHTNSNWPLPDLSTQEAYPEIVHRIRRKLPEIQPQDEVRQWSQKPAHDDDQQPDEMFYSIHQNEEPKLPSPRKREDPPEWFTQYMDQFKTDLSKELSNKIQEKLEDLVEGLNASEVETKLRSLLSEYSSIAREKVICCCKAPVTCTEKDTCENAASDEYLIKSHYDDQHFHPGMMHDHITSAVGDRPEETEMLKEATHGREPSGAGAFSSRKRSRRSRSRQERKKRKSDFVSVDAFLRTLHKREQELLKYMDKTNEKLKKKIEMKYNLQKAYSQFKDHDFAIQERERVLERIEGFRKRHNKTLAELGKLHKMMEGEQIKALVSDNTELTSGLNKWSLIEKAKAEEEEEEEEWDPDAPPSFYDAKFINDYTFPDGSKVSLGQVFVKEWRIMNTGNKGWTNQTTLCCTLPSLLKPQESRIMCPPLSSTQIGILKVTFTAPRTVGSFTSTFRFQNGSHLFGDHIWVNIEVVGVETVCFEPFIEPSGKLQLQRQISDPTSGIGNSTGLHFATPDQPELIHEARISVNELWPVQDTHPFQGDKVFSVDDKGFNVITPISYNLASREIGVELIKHVNYPQFCPILPHAVFLKKWLVKNVGNKPWSNKTKLFNARFLPDGEPLVAKIPHILPGHMGIIELLLKAGHFPESIYFTDFVLQNDGQYIKGVLPCTVHTFIRRPIPFDSHIMWIHRIEEGELMALQFAAETHLHYTPSVSTPPDDKRTYFPRHYNAYACQEVHEEKRRLSCPNQPLNRACNESEPPKAVDEHQTGQLIVDDDVDRVSNVAVASECDGCNSPTHNISDEESIYEGEYEEEKDYEVEYDAEGEEYDAEEEYDVEEGYEGEYEAEEEYEEEGAELDEYDESEEESSDSSDADETSEVDHQQLVATNKETANTRSYDAKCEAEDDPYLDIYPHNTPLEEFKFVSIKDELEQQEIISHIERIESKHNLLEYKEKKEVSTLQEVYQQNVEIKLDFDVIPKVAIKAHNSEGKSEGRPPSDPLRFEEKHFMVSNLPPPPPPLAKPVSSSNGANHGLQDSDDESLDEIIFVPPPSHNIPPSCNEESMTEDSVSRDLASAMEEDDMESSVTCSSFSELDTEDEHGGEDDQDGDISSPIVSESMVELPECFDFDFSVVDVLKQT